MRRVALGSLLAVAVLGMMIVAVGRSNWDVRLIVGLASTAGYVMGDEVEGDLLEVAALRSEKDPTPDPMPPAPPLYPPEPVFPNQPTAACGPAIG